MRRSAIEVAESIFRFLALHDETTFSELAEGINTNTKVVHRWLSLIEFIQNNPEVISTDIIHSQNQKPYGVRFVSKRRKVLDTRFFTYDNERYEFIQAFFSTEQSSDLLIVDLPSSLERNDMVYRKVIIGTNEDGTPSIDPWSLYKLLTTRANSVMNYALSSYPKKNLISTGLGIPHRNSKHLIEIAEGMISEDMDERTQIFIARLQFATNKKFLQEDHDLSPSATFWLVMEDYLHGDSSYLSEDQLYRLMIRIRNNPVGYFNIMKLITNSTGTHNPFLSSNYQMDEWDNFFYILSSEYLQFLDPYRRLGVLFSALKLSSSKKWDFITHVLITKISKDLHKLIGEPQLVWLDLQQTHGRKLFGFGEVHLSLLLDQIRSAFISYQFNAVKELVSLLLNTYLISASSPLWNDLNYVNFLSTLDYSLINHNSRYGLSILGSSTIIPNTEEGIGETLFPHSLRRILSNYTLTALRIIVESDTNVTSGLIMDSAWDIDVQHELCYYFLGLPEFNLVKNIPRQTLSKVSSHFEMSRKLPYLQAIRLAILNKGGVSSRNIRAMLKGLPKRKLDKSELLYAIQYYNDNFLDDNNIRKLLSKFQVKEPLQRVSVYSSDARWHLFQRLLPRVGRKPSKKQVALTGLKEQIPVDKLYMLLYHRERVIEMMRMSFVTLKDD